MKNITNLIINNNLKLKERVTIMAVNYKLYQCKREGRFLGKWYARAVHNGVVGTDELAEIMQRNCTVKKSDIKAVLTELVEVMQDELQNSKRVRIDGLGSFKLGISSLAAPTAKEYTIAKHVKRVHVLFMPETKIDAGSHKRSKVLVNGAKLAELTNYDVKKTDAAAPDKKEVGQ
ncbi:putative DNA-binding protein [Prevotella sp. DNF00663]|nr:putative DNA-binding protein [Prevotella sp. DNF00663]